jgi:hypothetical protein
LKQHFCEDYAHLMLFPKSEIFGVHKKIAATLHTLLTLGREQNGILRHNLYFGIGLFWTTRYKTHSAMVRGPNGLEGSMGLLAHAAVQHLAYFCHEQLGLEPVVSADHTAIISPYSNYMK